MAASASQQARIIVTKEFSLTNARLILDGEVSRGTIHVADNLIVSIDLGETIHTNAIDCGGDFLSPGLIELHTDNLERHRKPRPGVLQPMRDALLAHDGELASTGITTVFDALRIGSVISDGRNAYEPYALEAASTMRRLKEDNHLRIDHQVHLRAEVCSETLAEELEEFGPEQDIGIVSLMDHTPGQRQFRDTAQLILYLKGKYGMSDTDIEQHFTNMRNLQDRHGSAHRKATVAFANAAGAVLASHDDTTIDDVAQSRAVNCRLAEFPTTLEAASECNDAGIAVMMGAPNLMRGKSHSGNVSAAELVSTGDLQILSSDYIPSTLLRAAVKLGIMLDDMAAAMKMVTVTPAQVVGLDDRGRLARGQRADILRFGLEESQPIIRGVWSAGRQVA
ncbi:MAG: alpha-D-ribose 1-methylphosphonate 5-triphosphate diphosphatase [Pseudomonadota bacterium]|nr:alpha-D-ribose 1-methylphosphonate 5-triphosphate diphosphatase [Pseudomonadota bacterium]